jgi:hypothetical protein
MAIEKIAIFTAIRRASPFVGNKAGMLAFSSGGEKGRPQ